jgi:rhodanese-related sulfurtransferase
MNKKNVKMKQFFLGILLIGLSSSSFGQVESRAFQAVIESMLKKTVPTISVGEVKREENLILLDTRSKREFEVSHLKYARWVGYDEFNLSRVKDLPKNAPIVVYCSIGVRSEQIGEKLKKAGFTNVKNMYGSIFEWINQGNPVYDKNDKLTKKIHGFDKSWGIWCKEGEKVY